MKIDKNTDTEKNILNAAKQVFMREGKSGARMQDIADLAQINKALLHYYFRSKDKLFEAVVKDIIQNFAFNEIEKLLASDLPFYEKLALFIEKYIELLAKHPFLPIFILNEIAKDAENIQLFKPMQLLPTMFSELITGAIKNGVIKPVHPLHFMVNTISLCVFPFVARPLLKTIIFESNQEKFDAFIQERKKEVYKLIVSNISL
ncbi:MAG TPA: TetR/AcrR family transcriptional regulator [Bacteroidales bacterium]|nr:TetR/AcrR family transcriptional regulator [Bacteroidales bacterium]